MGVDKLAETVILQAVEDLFDETLEAESREFFRGGTFAYWAGLAGLDSSMRRRLLLLVEPVLVRVSKLGRKRKRLTAPGNGSQLFYPLAGLARMAMVMPHRRTRLIS